MSGARERRRSRQAAGGLLAAALTLSAVPGAAARADTPDDPLYASRGSWGNDFDDQWGLKRIGFDTDGANAWAIEDGSSSPVVVAVIDSGLDFYHPDLQAENIWYNPYEVVNGRDDDGNGYIDDVYGWDFVDHDNKPWDRGGHGTAVAGILAAATANAEGIAGMNRGVRVMVLRVLNATVAGGAVPVAAAIHYAVEHGAQVINLSLGGRTLSLLEAEAVRTAFDNDVVVVAAAGNEGIDVASVAPAGLDGLIAVAATDQEDRHAPFSNWGPGIDIAAPGVEILTLRARFTDVVLAAGDPEYQAGSRFVGPHSRYYRVSGTSFAAPFVTGAASLLLARKPELSAVQVTRILTQSARDIEPPGVDQFTGHGLLDVVAALEADPGFFITASIDGLGVVQQDGAQLVRISGTADADRMREARIEIGAGEAPAEWKQVSRKIKKPVSAGVLADVDAAHFAGAKQWTIRLVVRHKNGKEREYRYLLTLG